MEITSEPHRHLPSGLVDKDRLESSGAVIMRPRTGDFWACWGQVDDNDYEHFKLAPTAARGA